MNERTVLSSREWREKTKAGKTPARVCIRKGILDAHPKQIGEDGERKVRFVISSAAVDRDRDTISPNGWKLDNFRRDPVVLWAHDHRTPAIARSTEISIQEGRLVADAEFPNRDIHPFGDMIFRMVTAGFLRAASVGFQPLRWEINEERRGTDFNEQELLEFSVVNVPSNPEALIAAKAARIDIEPMIEWAERVLDSYHEDKGIYLPRRKVEQVFALLADGKFISAAPESVRAADSPADKQGEKGIVPRNVSDRKAAADAEWSRPALADFTDQPWSDLSQAEKRKIAGHFAWAQANPPETFGGLKLPHHRPSDGAAVWRGIAAAMGVLLGARGGANIPGEDRRKVYDHLAAHYRAFEKDPPEFREAPDPEARQVPVFAAGILTGWAIDMAGRVMRTADGGATWAAVEDAEAETGLVRLLLLGDGPVGKRGRVLSRANENKIRKAIEALQQVLESLADTQDDSAQAPTAKAGDADDGIAIELDDDEETSVVDPRELRGLIEEAARSAAQVAITELTGRLD